MATNNFLIDAAQSAGNIAKNAWDKLQTIDDRQTYENIFQSPYLNPPFNPDGQSTGLFNSRRAFPLRLVAGGNITEDAIRAHVLNKNKDYGGGLKGYRDESLDGYVPQSDAVDGYHYRSGKDFGKLATGDSLPLGGVPALVAGHLYQQAQGLFDGTWGNNAYLQGVDNMHGMMASGKAPAVQSLYDFGSNIHNILNPTKVDINALGGPMVKGNVQEVNPIVEPTVKPVEEPTVTKPINIPKYNTPQGPAGYTKPKRSYAQQASAVNRKAKSMGVKSPIRRSGNKYGFGL